MGGATAPDAVPCWWRVLLTASCQGVGLYGSRKKHMPWAERGEHLHQLRPLAADFNFQWRLGASRQKASKSGRVGLGYLMTNIVFGPDGCCCQS